MTEYAVLAAAVLVLAAFCIRDVRVAVRKAIRRAFDDGYSQGLGKRFGDALDRAIGLDRLPRQTLTLVRDGGRVEVELTVRALTEGEWSFMRRAPGGHMASSVVAAALVYPKLDVDDLEQAFLPGELDRIATAIVKLSGIGEVH